MFELWDIHDVYKALMALGAGAILGVERELKDKAAGLKTITVICLGSCLFTILSFKIGNQYNDASRIASYIVSGIGFLGAGVIFKDEFTVSGLTTAGVIWMAAAIGMAIGFGEVFSAGVFLLACLLIIYTGRYLNLRLFSNKTNKMLKVVLTGNSADHKNNLLNKITPYISRMEQARLESYPDKMVITLDIMIKTKQLPQLELFLFKEENIESFEL